MTATVRRGGRRGPPAEDLDNGPARALAETPTQRIIAGANAVTYTVSPAGVKLGVRKLPALDEMRLTRAIGGDASNATYFLWCMLAAAVASIDGDALPMPQSTLECEAVIARIGDDGVMALQRLAEAQAKAAAAANAKASQ